MSSEIKRNPRLSVLPLGLVVAGKYRIDQVLAEGGMGVIYRGWHLVLDQPIAVKVMRPELAERPEANLRFLNEARAAARLRGSNVARVLDSGAIAAGSAELLYIVLEYLEGADLRTVLEEEGALPLDRAVDFVLQACEALAEAHAAGIVHRDVKPENLFLTRQPDGSEIIKLLDFGISKRADADPRTESAEAQSLGSPHYMSPEQMSEPASVDARGDIWSLGIVTYELLTLRVPFDGDTLATVCAQVLGREPEPLSVYCEDLPPEVENAVLACLRKDREHRHGSVYEFAQAIGPFGTLKAEESLRRIKRIFERQASEPVIEIDVDLSHIGQNSLREQAQRQLLPVPSPAPANEESIEITFEPVRRRHIGRRIAVAAAAAAAALAFSLPGGTTVDNLKTRTAEVLTPLGERAMLGAERLSAQVSRRLQRQEGIAPEQLVPSRVDAVPDALQSSEAAQSMGTTAASVPLTPVPISVEPRLSEPSTESKTAPKSPTAQRRPHAYRPIGPARVRSESSEPSEVPASTESPPAKLQRLIPPYVRETPSGLRSGSDRSSEFASTDRYGLDAGAFASQGRASR
jgi:serine/threonine protein kinase